MYWQLQEVFLLPFRANNDHFHTFLSVVLSRFWFRYEKDTDKHDGRSR